MNQKSDIVEKKLKYFQKILNISIRSAEQFDTKQLDFPTYYSYTPESNMFNIDLANPLAMRFCDKLKRMTIDQSIVVTIRFIINNISYPILVAFATDDHVENNLLQIRGYWFKLHTPTFISLGFELEEIIELNQEFEELSFVERVGKTKKILKDRFESASIVPNQFLIGIVNITSFDKIIKERIDSNLRSVSKLKDSDLVSKYLSMDLNSLIPNRLMIFPVQENLNEDQSMACESFFGTRMQTLNGPPGTGKSQTITEFLLQSILYEKKVLITSYNNKPVDVVYTKLQEAIGLQMPFPCYSQNLTEIFKQFVSYITILKSTQTKKSILTTLDELEIQFNNLQEEYELIDSVKKAEIRLEYLKLKYPDLLENSNKDEFHIRDEYFKKLDFLNENQKEIKKLKTKLIKNKKIHSQLQKELIIAKMNYNYIQIYDRDLEILKDAIDNPNRIYQARKVMEDIVDSSPIVFSNILKAINNLPDKKNFFDYILVDEASQCNSIAVVPLLTSTRSLIVIGDPQQLKHIPNPAITKKIANKTLEELEIISEKGFDYIDLSLFDYVDLIRINSYQPELFLTYHYRCNPDIIEFSNTNYYNSRLKLIKEETNSSLHWHNIQGQASTLNFNDVEANAVYTRILHYLKEYKPSEIGVISQYRNQVSRIKKVLETNSVKGISVGTIHTFQGDEKKVILYSPVYSIGSNPKSLDFINVTCYNLLNVALTRSQDVFEVVGDLDFALNNFTTESEVYFKLAHYITNKKKIV
ncbi:MAG: DEAD/DEAH box helicase [Patescibacteria group bacterium]